MPRLKGDSGQTVQTGRLLGKGGEGSVYEIAGQNGVLAKIYHNKIGAEKISKLKAMTALKTEALSKIAAWPTEVLFDGSTATGFLMPYATGHRDIHLLYTPKSRKDTFPKANWPFLIHAATNVARSFAVIHEHGCVIGDVNHGSVLASDAATVRLIDCDSFQINSNGQRYLCSVGVPDYIPW